MTAETLKRAKQIESQILTLESVIRQSKEAKFNYEVTSLNIGGVAGGEKFTFSLTGCGVGGEIIKELIAGLEIRVDRRQREFASL